jgi:hypothetical protein
MIPEINLIEELNQRENSMSKTSKKRKGKVDTDRGRIKNHDEVADSVMIKIAGENKMKSQPNSAGEWNNLNSSNDLALLKDRVMLPMTLVSAL